MKTIPFNIWDDYDDEKFDSGTYGYVEEYDVLTEDEKCEIVALIASYIKTNLDTSGFIVEADGEDLTFEKLTHERREKLVKELEVSELTYNGTKIEFYSES